MHESATTRKSERRRDPELQPHNVGTQLGNSAEKPPLPCKLPRAPTVLRDGDVRAPRNCRKPRRHERNVDGEPDGAGRETLSVSAPNRRPRTVTVHHRHLDVPRLVAVANHVQFRHPALVGGLRPEPVQLHLHEAPQARRHPQFPQGLAGVEGDNPAPGPLWSRLSHGPRGGLPAAQPRTGLTGYRFSPRRASNSATRASAVRRAAASRPARSSAACRAAVSSRRAACSSA